MESETLIALTSIVVSGVVGMAGVVLGYRSHSRKDALEDATRRTQAMEMLSEEEYTLLAVEMECRSIAELIELEKTNLDDAYAPLSAEAARILSESTQLLRSVREKRANVEKDIQKLSAPEIEEVIAKAYHGKRKADAQLLRTKRSISDVIDRRIARPSP